MQKPILNPFHPANRVLPILQQQEKNYNDKIPSFVPAEQKPESPTRLFQDYLKTGDKKFLKASNAALSILKRVSEADHKEPPVLDKEESKDK